MATGYKHTDSSKAKISAAHKGKIISDETKALMAKAKAGVKFTSKHKDNLTKARKGSRTVLVGDTVTGIRTYETISRAARAEKCDRASVINRCNSVSDKFTHWSWG